MNRNLNKIAGRLFGLGSLTMCLMIAIYFAGYQPPTGTWEYKLNYMNEKWGMIAAIWIVEFLTVLVFTWVSFHFSRINSWWYLLAIGHLFMLTEYALMLGGYRQVVTEEGFNLVNGLAQWVFIASNFIWLVGMTAVYLTEGGWLRLAGAVLSALCALLVFLILTGLGGPGLLMIVGSLVILLYFLNAYYGFRILAYQEEIVHRQTEKMVS